MKDTRLRAVDLVRRIRDHQARRLAGKTPSAIIAFYRAVGDAALAELQPETKVPRRKPAKELKLTKPGILRSFAAYPWC
jgi:hypothetical protein